MLPAKKAGNGFDLNRTLSYQAQQASHQSSAPYASSSGNLAASAASVQPSQSQPKLSDTTSLPLNMLSLSLPDSSVPRPLLTPSVLPSPFLRANSPEHQKIFQLTNVPEELVCVEVHQYEKDVYIVKFTDHSLAEIDLQRERVRLVNDQGCVKGVIRIDSQAYKWSRLYESTKRDVFEQYPAYHAADYYDHSTDAYEKIFCREGYVYSKEVVSCGQPKIEQNGTYDYTVKFPDGSSLELDIGVDWIFSLSLTDDRCRRGLIRLDSQAYQFLIEHDQLKRDQLGAIANFRRQNGLMAEDEKKDIVN